MTLPIDRTALTNAASNQVPSLVLASALNIAALRTPYDAIDELYAYTNTALAGFVGSGTAQQFSITNVTVAPYTADPTGVLESSTTIQAAIDACYAAGGGTVFLPKGTYKISTTLIKKDNVSLVGAGKYLTTLNWAGANTSSIIDCTNKVIHGTYIKGMTLTNTDGVTNVITGVLGGSDSGVYNSTGITFDDIRFYKLKYSTKAGSADISFYDCIYNNCTAESCYYGFWVQGSQTTIFYPRVISCTYGLVVEYLSSYSKGGVEVFGGEFLTNTNDILVPNVNGTRPCSFYGTWFEGSPNPIFSATTANTQLFTWSFYGCMLSSNSTTYVMDFNNANGLVTISGSMLYQTDVTYSKVFRSPSTSAGVLSYDCNIKKYDATYEFYSNRANIRSYNTTPLLKEQTGITASTSLTGTAYTTIAVVFDQAFAAAPFVYAQPGSSQRITCTVGSITTTGCNIICYNWDATASTTVKWLAKGN